MFYIFLLAAANEVTYCRGFWAIIATHVLLVVQQLRSWWLMLIEHRCCCGCWFFVMSDEFWRWSCWVASLVHTCCSSSSLQSGCASLLNLWAMVCLGFVMLSAGVEGYTCGMVTCGANCCCSSSDWPYFFKGNFGLVEKLAVHILVTWGAQIKLIKVVDNDKKISLSICAIDYVSLLLLCVWQRGARTSTQTAGCASTTYGAVHRFLRKGRQRNNYYSKFCERETNIFFYISYHTQQVLWYDSITAVKHFFFDVLKIKSDSKSYGVYRFVRVSAPCGNNGNSNNNSNNRRAVLVHCQFETIRQGGGNHWDVLRHMRGVPWTVSSSSVNNKLPNQNRIVEIYCVIVTSRIVGDGLCNDDMHVSYHTHKSYPWCIYKSTYDTTRNACIIHKRKVYRHQEETNPFGISSLD